MKFLKSLARVVRAPLTQLAVTKLAQIAQKPGISAQERLAVAIVTDLLQSSTTPSQ